MPISEHFHRQVYGGVFDPGSPLADADSFRTDVIAALRELRVPVVRWPGGCFVSAYHWLHGVGHERKPSYDKACAVEDPNTFGTDEFVAWCRKIGAEPYICTNAGTGTPEEMSDWVEYVTACGGSLGTVAPGQWPYAAARRPLLVHRQRKLRRLGDGRQDGARMGRYVAESAKMMKRVDPSIRLLAVALADVDWTLNLLRQAGTYLDMVSIHGYYDPLWQRDEPSDYATCVVNRGRSKTLSASPSILLAWQGLRVSWASPSTSGTCAAGITRTAIILRRSGRAPQ